MNSGIDPQTQRQLTLGEAAFGSKDYGIAEGFFRVAVRMAPDEPEPRLLLAGALAHLNKGEESIREALKALELDPLQPKAFLLLARTYQRLGRFAEAIQSAESAISLDPEIVRPYTDIVRCKKMNQEDSALVSRLNEMARQPGRRPGELIDLHVALGKAYDDQSDFERALHHFERGNEIGASEIAPVLQYSQVQERRAADYLMTPFTERFFSHHRNLGSESELPLFIVGMIRSGTTLLDTILSSHHQVKSAGELTFWEDAALPLLVSAHRGPIPPAQLREVADTYRRQLREVGITSKRVIDKMPMNYQYIGLIHAAFPKARFIHVRRNPIDTCISIYTTYFNLPPKFAFLKSNIAHAYKQYLRFMDHWRSVIPADRFVEVDYEELVGSKRSVLPELIQFASLDWDERVVNHEANQTDVSTPSVWQARQPIFQTSVARRRNYPSWLREFEELL